MRIRLNGEERAMPGGATLQNLVDGLDLEGRAVAIEVNREVVPRARFAAVRLRDGDRVEVVTFVGGG